MICQPEDRLGRNGAYEIKNHPFFYGVDFNSLRRIAAPFAPTLSSDVDTSCFPVDDLPQGSEGDVIQDGTPTTMDEASNPENVLPFLGYTFKRFEKAFN